MIADFPGARNMPFLGERDDGNGLGNKWRVARVCRSAVPSVSCILLPLVFDCNIFRFEGNLIWTSIEFDDEIHRGCGTVSASSDCVEMQIAYEKRPALF